MNSIIKNSDGSVTIDGQLYTPVSQPSSVKSDLADEFVFTMPEYPSTLWLRISSSEKAPIDLSAWSPQQFHAVQDCLRHYGRELIRRAEKSSGGLIYTVKGFKTSILNQIKEEPE